MVHWDAKNSLTHGRVKKIQVSYGKVCHISPATVSSHISILNLIEIPEQIRFHYMLDGLPFNSKDKLLRKKCGFSLPQLGNN